MCKKLNNWNTTNTKIILILNGRSNVYLIKSKNESAIVDMGNGKKNQKLINYLEKDKTHKVKYIVLTHTHFDHAGGAFALKNRLNAKTVVNANEANNLEKGFTPIPRGTNPFTEVIFFVGSKLKKLGKYPPCAADIIVKNAQSIKLGNAHCQLISTPGHSAGSMSIVVDNEIALVGDTLFSKIPGTITPPFADDKQQMLSSWQGLLNTGCSLFLPGHGRAISRDRFSKYLKKHQNG